jgi:hypothetical protein
VTLKVMKLKIEKIDLAPESAIPATAGLLVYSCNYTWSCRSDMPANCHAIALKCSIFSPVSSER